jgi:phage-related protein
MKKKFEILILEDVWDFLEKAENKIKEKIIYNMDKAKYVNDPELFKKLDNDIWEFRTKQKKMHFRVLAFWDKENQTDVLVVATHGLIKKTDKIPKREIEKAKSIRMNYFEQKTKRS